MGKTSGKRPIVHKKALHDYEVLEKLEAGMVLTGSEVKSVRLGRVQMRDSFAVIRDGEAFLLNVHISAYDFAANEDYEPTRSRKLLLKRREIERLVGKLQTKGLSLVPLRIYEKQNRFKVELGLVRGRKEYQKKEVKKRRDVRREVEREVKARYKG